MDNFLRRSSGVIMTTFSNYGFIIDDRDNKTYYFKLNELVNIVDVGLSTFKIKGCRVSYDIVSYYDKLLKKEQTRAISIIIDDIKIKKDAKKEIDKLASFSGESAKYESTISDSVFAEIDVIEGEIISISDGYKRLTLKDKAGPIREFYPNKTILYKSLQVGEQVLYVPFVDEQGIKTAKYLKRQSNLVIEDYQLDLYTKITKWNEDAIKENNILLFYKTEELSQIEDGQKFFVLGMKGTGKSAIANYLQNRDAVDEYCLTLRFTDYPFSELNNLADKLYSSNQHYNLWKYLIYISCLELMSFNPNIDKKLKDHLNKVFPNRSTQSSIISKIRNIKDFELKLNLFDFVEVSTNTSEAFNFKDLSLAEKIDYLESLIFKYIDNSKYYILFDELEDDLFLKEETRSNYFEMIIALFKAVYQIKLLFSETKNIKISPVVFLREDIYSHEMFIVTNKNRWSEHIINLRWDATKINKMLTYRVSVESEYYKEKSMKSENIWHALFDGKYIESRKGPIEIHHIISSHTYNRPRDFILFMQACCRAALKYNIPDLKEVFSVSITSYSFKLRSEKEAELYGIINNVKMVFNIISHIRSILFKYDKFCQEYEKSTNSTQTANEVLNILYNYSIIGNKIHTGSAVYKHTNIHSTFNSNEPVELHMGLRQSLNIK